MCTVQNLRPGLRRLLRRGRSREVVYDAVVLDELVHPSVFLALPGRSRRPLPGRARAPVFTLVHHLKCREGLRAGQRRLVRGMERHLLRRSDRLLVNSRTTEASVRQLLGDPPPIWVCRPGCDLQSGPVPTLEEVAAAPPVLLTTGNLIPRKGHDLLLQALAGLQKLPWRLRVVGRPVDRRYLKRLQGLLARHGLVERVCFTGQLSGRALAAEYGRADIFVFPSRYEGFGISLAEALRAGLPFVAFACGAVPELVGSCAGVPDLLGGSAAVPGLVAEGDVEAFRQALRRLLTDPACRTAAAARSRALGARLPSWEQTGECFYRALREGIGRAC
jgi:glycosyltransferase involved in cell wall biosynthesis